MIRDKIFHKPMIREDFTLRGKEVGRLEGLSDGIFSLAIGLLLVSSQVPESFHELLSFIEDFPAFFLCILMVSRIWRMHYEFFLLYGLKDKFSILINFFLLFLVLFYVYPLKFLASFVTKWFFLEIKLVFSHQEIYQKELNRLFTQVISTSQLPVLSVIYSIGLMMIFWCFAIFYGHAYRLREVLHLSPLEVQDTYFSRYWMWFFTFISFLSVLVALIGVIFHRPLFSFWSGMVFWLIPLGGFIVKRIKPEYNQ